jgi:Taurine catabolism dioxygenase TauD, TfdA family
VVSRAEAGEPAFYPLPVFSDSNGTPRVFCIGWYVRDAQRHSDAPRFTDAQLEAMELLEDIANDPAFHVTMDFQPGDGQLLNNAKILHSREGYEDHDEPEGRRHSLRLWLPHTTSPAWKRACSALPPRLPPCRSPAPHPNRARHPREPVNTTRRAQTTELAVASDDVACQARPRSRTRTGEDAAPSRAEGRTVTDAEQRCRLSEPKQARCSDKPESCEFDNDGVR